MKLIPLSQGKVARIDNCDFERVSKFKWFAVASRKGVFYARRNVWLKDKKRCSIMSMHRFIMGASKGVQVDHRDCDGLNNTRVNLRIADSRQQSRNRRVQERSKSGFKGVVWHERDAIYEASIRVGGHLIYLGRSKCPREAAKMYDEAAIAHFAEFAKTNSMMGLLNA